ncbi:MAG: RNA 2',3'-cyclic phosphodiesterase [Chloroflexi bacterium]|nr:RNA 2',3'-cyclic phosphodiesterase [Chloroflexota bacterium]
MRQTMRLFIAVPLPQEVKTALETTSANLGRGLSRGAIRWVRPAQMHLTLFFLGETAVSHLPSLQEQLNQLTSQHASFVLQLNGIGLFPNRKKPRIVWAGRRKNGRFVHTSHWAG